jgi:hypothetical protein
MTNQYDNTNRGAVWPNARRRDGKNDPQFTGTINVDGKDYWISAWDKKPGASESAPFLSLSVRPVEDKPQQQSYQKPAQDMPDDEIPW